MNMAEKLKILRGDKTQEQVVKEIAEKTGEKIGITSYRLYEAGERTDKDTYEPIKARLPSIDTLKILADYFQVDIKCLIYDEIDITSPENVDINKRLGLTDKAINVIEKIKNEMDTSLVIELNSFIENDDFIPFLSCLSKLKLYNKYTDFFEDDIKAINEKHYDIKLINKALNDIKHYTETLDDFSEIYDETIRILEDINDEEAKKKKAFLYKNNGNNKFVEHVEFFIVQSCTSMNEALKKELILLKYTIDEFIRKYRYKVEKGSETNVDSRS